MLKEVKKCFTEEDNNFLSKIPEKDKIYGVIKSGNQNSSPGTDGITFFLYNECWPILSKAFTDMTKAVFSGSSTSRSQRTSLLAVGDKLSKGRSINPRDKRKISLLNTDFKTFSGIESRRFRSVMSHTVSPLQLVSREDQRIGHGIALARDAIEVANREKLDRIRVRR